MKNRELKAKDIEKLIGGDTWVKVSGIRGGLIPLEDYLELRASQAGYESYQDVLDDGGYIPLETDDLIKKDDICRNLSDILLGLSVKYNGNFDKIFEALEKKEYVISIKEVEEIKKTLDCHYAVTGDDNYPERFRRMNNAPFVIFYKGAISALSENAIGIDGNTHITENGKAAVDKAVYSLARKRYTICTSDYKGTDEYVIEAAKKMSARIAVAAVKGLEKYDYPDNPNVVYFSECPYGENHGIDRIVSSGKGLLLIEAKTMDMKSKTVMYAQANERNIYLFDKKMAPEFKNGSKKYLSLIVEKKHKEMEY